MPAVFKDYVRMMVLGFALLMLFGSTGFLIQRTSTTLDIEPIQAADVDTSRQDLLVDTTWLVAQLNDAEVTPVIIDVSDPETYAREHIPGAIHLWWQDTMNLNGAGYGEAFSLSARSSYRPDLGANQDDIIVVYDNASSEHASRVVWQLRTSGYHRAVVLDGGLAAWKGAGQPVTPEAAQPAEVGAPDETWIAENEITTPELAEQINNPNLVLIDTRSDEEKRDTINDTIREGQIPGSRSLLSDAVMREDGTFASPDELEQILSPLGLSPEDEIVIYGRFGIETGQVWLALRLAGYESVRVYDDGWLAWGYDVALPIEPVESPTP
jgi:thiosulfate/3-mercaptopyruvate sulfurtransferase